MRQRRAAEASTATVAGRPLDSMRGVLRHLDMERAACQNSRFVHHPREQVFAESSIPERFRAQVRLHPGRIALAADGLALDYARLGRVVDGAARRLASLSSANGSSPWRVVLLADQGAPAVVTTLAALCAGAAYVPLDPWLPADGLREQIGLAAPSLVAAQRPYLDTARAACAGALPLVCIDDLLAAALADEVGTPGGIVPAAYAGPPVDGDSIAYLYFTSGSTGRPKGVYDHHRNVLHNVWRYTKHLRIGPDDRLSLLQSPHFSGAVSSMFGALLNGATCCPFDVRREGADRVGPWMRERRVTIYHSVPAVFREAVAGGGFPDLRCVRLEGDRASARDVEVFRACCPPGAMLANGLGATECGLVRQWRIDARTPLPDGPVPIGDAIDDMEALLLDDARREVPPGAVGEIAVRSRYLALGYWRQPELTAQRFLDVAGDPSRRIYLTGDLGRLRADGMLEYLGRKDHAPKVNGQWIDSGSIERVLARQPDVAEAVVAVREAPDRGGDARIVAWVVPRDPSNPPRADALRAAVACELSPALVPRAVVSLPRLPLNANLKVDRAALPEPGDEPDHGRAPRAPRGDTESRLEAIWREVLGLEAVGVVDDLFALGADSMAATKARNRIAAAFGRELPVTWLFERPTIAAQAAALRPASPPQRSG